MNLRESFLKTTFSKNLNRTTVDAVGIESFLNSQFLKEGFGFVNLDPAIEKSCLTFSQSFALDFISKGENSEQIMVIEEIIREESLFGEKSLVQSLSRLEEIISIETESRNFYHFSYTYDMIKKMNQPFSEDFNILLSSDFDLVENFIKSTFETTYEPPAIIQISSEDFQGLAIREIFRNFGFTTEETAQWYSIVKKIGDSYLSGRLDRKILAVIFEYEFGFSELFASIRFRYFIFFVDFVFSFELNFENFKAIQV